MPEPEAPTRKTNSPFSTSTVTWSRAAVPVAGVGLGDLLEANHWTERYVEARQHPDSVGVGSGRVRRPALTRWLAQAAPRSRRGRSPAPSRSLAVLVGAVAQPDHGARLRARPTVGTRRRGRRTTPPDRRRGPRARSATGSPDAVVEHALGGGAGRQSSGWDDGDRDRLARRLGTVAHEFGCTWQRPTATRRAPGSSRPRSPRSQAATSPTAR